MGKFYFGIALVGIAGLIAGCGGPPGIKTAKAKGLVKYKGKPLGGASVTFVPEKGQIAVGTTMEDGTFEITTNGRPGVALGLSKVTVTKQRITLQGTSSESPRPEDMITRAKQDAAKGSKKAAESAKDEVPIRYANPGSSGLTAEVDADASKNVFEYNLTD